MFSYYMIPEIPFVFISKFGLGIQFEPSSGQGMFVSASIDISK